MNADETLGQTLERKGYCYLNVPLSLAHAFDDLFTEGALFFSLPAEVKQRATQRERLLGYRRAGMEYSRYCDRPDLVEAFAKWHHLQRFPASKLLQHIVSRGPIVADALRCGRAEGVFAPEFIGEHVPLGRADTGEEIAGVVGCLASDAAGYVTGQVIPVNGGLA